MDWTDRLISNLKAHGLTVRDVRGFLAKHATLRYAERDPSKLRGMVWHQAMSYGYGQQTVEAIAKYHVGPTSHLKSGGAPGFAYTLAVDADGTVFVCQPVELATWSHGQKLVPDANTRLMGVCALGAYTYTGGDGLQVRKDEPPTPQEAALVRVWQAAQALWGWASDAPSGGLLGHHDLGKPSCPGERLETVQRALRAGTALPDVLDTLTLTGRAQVVARQACLKALGFGLGFAGVDGKDGPVTASAVRAFQYSYDLIADGRWGPRTEAEMRAIMLERYPRTARPLR